MTPLAWIILGLAGAFAVGNWIAVRPGARSNTAKYICKPATLALLIVLALVIEADRPAQALRAWFVVEPDLLTQRAWFVAALVLSLAGDVFLMLPSDAFIAGLGSFFLAHIAYIAGLGMERSSLTALGVCVAIVAIAALPVGTRIVAGVLRGKRPAMTPAVAAYIAIISVMVASALAARDAVAFGGAALFFVSDAIIGWNRFVRPIRWAQPAIMSTYHVGQALLVLSLLN